MMTTHYIQCGDHLNKMQNPGFDCDLEGRDRNSTVELGSVTSTHPLNGATGCSDDCLTLHRQHQAAADKMGTKPMESPWHRLKSFFLVGTIALLVAWIVGYTLFSQLDLL